jgi:hypothetical protein
MVATLDLQIEVVGCPTVCRHCWAQGVPYPAMPVADVAWVLEETHRFCEATGSALAPTRCTSWPATPRRRSCCGCSPTTSARPSSSRCRPPGSRWPSARTGSSCWRPPPAWARPRSGWPATASGSSTTGRSTGPAPGSRPAWPSQRAHAVGLRAGCNVFVTTANIGQAERLLGALGRLEVDQMAWEPATYYPTPRGRRSERLRPQLVDLLPVADRICQRSRFHGDAWANPQAYTEAAWVARALAGDWPPQLAEVEPHASSQGLPLVCRPGLELHTGVAGRYRERHGNLRADGGQAVLRRALEQADGPSTQCGSGRNSGRRLASWPPSTVTKAGKGSTSARRRFAICGWTGRGEPDAPPHSPRRRRPGTARRPSDGCGRLQLDPGRAGWSR